MQINSNYSMNGVPYETRRKQDNIPQFSTECVVQENENIIPYMEEVDFDEKAFDMIGSNAPQDVKDAWIASFPVILLGKKGVLVAMVAISITIYVHIKYFDKSQ